MKVVVIRHGKVLHDWKKWCTSAEFDEQCQLYNQAPIDPESDCHCGFGMFWEDFSGLQETKDNLKPKPRQLAGLGSLPEQVLIAMRIVQ